MAINDILQGLPSFNKENFSQFTVNDNIKSTNVGSTSYIQTEDCQENSKVIVTDKTNILLRYLRKQLDSKKPNNKRNCNDVSLGNPPDAKIPRVDDTTTPTTPTATTSSSQQVSTPQTSTNRNEEEEEGEND